jgi:hypothetical protein
MEGKGQGIDMFNILQKIASILFLLIILGLMIYFGRHLVKGDPREEMDFFRYILMDEATAHVAKELPRLKEVRSLLLLPVVRDSTGAPGRPGFVTEMLFKRIRSASKYTILTIDDLEDEKERESYLKRLLKDARSAVDLGKKLASEGAVLSGIKKHASDAPPADTPPADTRSASANRAVVDARTAAELGRKLKADGVLLAVLEQFSAGGTPTGGPGLGAEIDLRAEILDPKSGKAIPASRVGFSRNISSRFSLTYLAAAMNQSSGWWRLVIWLLVTGALPWVTYRIAVEVLSKEKNLYNAILLGSYTLTSLLVGLILIGFYFFSFWLGLLIVLGIVFAGFYSFIALEKIEELRK